MEDSSDSQEISALSPINPRSEQHELIKAIEGMKNLKEEELNQIEFDTSGFSEYVESILRRESTFSLPEISEGRMKLDIASEMILEISNLDRYFRHLTISKALSEALEVSKHKRLAQKITARKNLEKRREEYFLFQARKTIIQSLKQDGRESLLRSNISASEEIPEPVIHNEEINTSNLISRGRAMQREPDIASSRPVEVEDRESVVPRADAFLDPHLEYPEGIVSPLRPPNIEYRPSFEDIRRSLRISNLGPERTSEVASVHAQLLNTNLVSHEVPVLEEVPQSYLSSLKEIEHILEGENELPNLNVEESRTSKKSKNESECPFECANVVVEELEGVALRSQEPPARLADTNIYRQPNGTPEGDNDDDDDHLTNLAPVVSPPKRRRIRQIFDEETYIRDYAVRAIQQMNKTNPVERVQVYKGPPSIWSRTLPRNMFETPAFGNSELYFESRRADVLGSLWRRNLITEDKDLEDANLRLDLQLPKRSAREELPLPNAQGILDRQVMSAQEEQQMVVVEQRGNLTLQEQTTVSLEQHQELKKDESRIGLTGRGSDFEGTSRIKNQDLQDQPEVSVQQRQELVLLEQELVPQDQTSAALAQQLQEFLLQDKPIQCTNELTLRKPSAITPPVVREREVWLLDDSQIPEARQGDIVVGDKVRRVGETTEEVQTNFEKQTSFQEQQRVLDFVQQVSEIQRGDLPITVPEELTHLVGMPVSQILQPSSYIEGRPHPQSESRGERERNNGNGVAFSSDIKPPSEKWREFEHVENAVKLMWENSQANGGEKITCIRDVLEVFGEYNRENCLTLLRVLDKMSLKKKVILNLEKGDIRIKPFEVPFVPLKVLDLLDEDLTF